MATPKKKTIKKYYSRDLQIDHCSKISISDFNSRIKRAMAEIETEMDGDGIEKNIVDSAEHAAWIEFNLSYGYSEVESIDVLLRVDCNVTRMETQKEADLRERRSEKAKKSREENLRKEKEREMKVLERLKSKYGL